MIVSNGLKAGFARIDISPMTLSVPMGGFGANELRMSNEIVDPLYAHTTALESGEESCLYICVDLLGVSEKYIALYREAISTATGLRKDRIFICATHTHAGPTLASKHPNTLKYAEEILTAKLVDAAKRALADLKPAKLSYGTGEAGRPGCRLTFDRHYYAVEESKKDNYKPEDLLEGVGKVRSGYLKGEGYCAVQHKEEADHRIHVLRFTREAADDIVLFNFTSHSTFTGSPKRPQISSDYSGATINRLEELLPDVKFAFMQGCCGNLVPETEIEEEGIWGLTYPPRATTGFKGELPKVVGLRPWHKSHYAFGAMLAGDVFKILTQEMKDSETDTLAFRQRIHAANYDHSKDELVPKAEEALKVYHAEGHTPAAYAWCAQFGLGSVYACGDIVTKSKLPMTGDVELNAIRIGDCAIATIPFEPFCSTGQHIKKDSPFAMTIANGYSCGYQSYLSTKNSHPLSYEASRMRYEVGTAEILEDQLIEMLNELK